MFPFINHRSQCPKPILETDDCQIAFYNTHKIGKVFTKLKEKIASIERNRLIYKISCKDCDGSYIGPTKQTLRFGFIGPWKKPMKKKYIWNDTYIHGQKYY